MFYGDWCVGLCYYFDIFFFRGYIKVVNCCGGVKLCWKSCEFELVSDNVCLEIKCFMVIVGEMCF